jgi:hypothetical protein
MTKHLSQDKANQEYAEEILRNLREPHKSKMLKNALQITSLQQKYKYLRQNKKEKNENPK